MAAVVTERRGLPLCVSKIFCISSFNIVKLESYFMFSRFVGKCVPVASIEAVSIVLDTGDESGFHVRFFCIEWLDLQTFCCASSSNNKHRTLIKHEIIMWWNF